MSRRRVTDTLVAAGFALAGLVVVLFPAVAVQSDILNAGVGSLEDDVFVASAAVGVVHMVLAWRRLVDEERTATRRLHLWIASLNALVVLALGASLLLLSILYTFALFIGFFQAPVSVPTQFFYLTGLRTLFLKDLLLLAGATQAGTLETGIQAHAAVWTGAFGD